MQDELYIHYCCIAGVERTKRQYKKWKKKTGAAYQKRKEIDAIFKAKQEEARIEKDYSKLYALYA